MTREEFEQLVAEEFPNAIPEQFRSHISNLAFLVEDEPSQELRKKEHLRRGETLLGFYHGVPYPLRGDLYGIGNVLPDTITLYRAPIENEADDLMSIAERDGASIAMSQQAHMRAKKSVSRVELIRHVIRDTIWHEVAHHFGMDEHTVRFRESKRKKGGS